MASIAGKFKVIAEKLKIAVLRSNGFTIVELLVVMGVIACFSILIAANYHLGNKRVVLEMQANILAQNIRKMQSWAMAARQFGNVAQPGYGIYFNLANRSEYIFYLDNGSDGGAILPGNGRYDSGLDAVQETVVFDPKVEIDSCDPSPANIDFVPPDPMVIISNGGAVNADQATITLRLKDVSGSRSVVVNKAGLIYVH